MRFLGLALTLLLAFAGQNDPAAVDRFVAHFLAGEDDAAREMMDAALKAALTDARAEQIRAGLISRYGALKSAGAAWREDRVGVHTRYRVPVTYARTTIDLRVVLDASGKVAGLFVVPHAEPPYAPPKPPTGVREVEVVVGDAGRGLPGTLTLPQLNKPSPGVVLVHGSGPNDRDETIGPNKPFRDLAWGLASRGIAVLRYEKRSRARPEDLAALGPKLTVKEEVIDDARAALRLLRDRPEVDSARVYVLGHSLGGTLAPRIAKPEPRPSGMIVLAGATTPLPEKILEQSEYVASLDGEISAEEKERLAGLRDTVESLRRALRGKADPPAGNVLGAPFSYYEDLERHDPPAEAAALGIPVLVLQGDRDYQVTLEDYARWSDALSGKPFATLRRYRELDHLFRAGTGPSSPSDYDRPAPVATGVIDDIAAWVRTGTLPD